MAKYIIGEYYLVNGWPKRVSGVHNNGIPYFDSLGWWGYELVGERPLTDEDLRQICRQMVMVNDENKLGRLLDNYREKPDYQRLADILESEMKK